MRESTSSADGTLLDQGILAWVQAGRPLIADGEAASQLQRLDDADLLQAALSGAHRILIAPDARAYSALLPGAEALPGDDPAQIGAALKRPRGSRPAEAAVLVTAAPLPAAAVEAVSKSAPLPVFVYAGEAAAFERYLRAQAAVWKRAAGGQRLRCPGL